VILAGTYADSVLVGVAAFSVDDSFFSAVMLCYYSRSAACTELSLFRLYKFVDYYIVVIAVGFC